MRNTLKVLNLSRWAVLALLFSPFISHACTIIYPMVHVGMSFRVRVTDRGRPVQGLRLELSSEDSAGKGQIDVIYSVTNVDGYARFADLKTGSFLLRADHDGGVADGREMDVTPNGSTNEVVQLEWPNRTPLLVRSVGGILRGPEYYPQQIQGELSLSLLDGVSGRVVADLHTDGKGRFSFAGKIPSGIYYLRINPSGLRAGSGEPIEGMITIEVADNAKQDDLDLDLGWSSCGLGYSQMSSHPELTVSQLCGEIKDSEGAAVPYAQVMLLANSETAEVLEQTKSGTDGRFVLSEHHDGTYQLIIRSPGFGPFLRVVRIEATEASKGCKEPIPATLEVM